jgi:hypothetical protein
VLKSSPTQQAAKAQFHVRQSMSLEPQRYEAQGRKLIDKLVTLHFGCWNVFAAESSSSSNSLRPRADESPP